MRSKCAAAVDQRRAARLAAMTPEARVALAARLGEQGLTMFMAAYGLDRSTAIARVKILDPPSTLISSPVTRAF